MNKHKPAGITAATGAALLLIARVALAPAYAADQAQFQTAYAAAEQAEHQAGMLHDRWTPTEAALKEAREAAAAQHYAEATALARKAEELAKLSIAQARQQQTAWRDAVVR